jgi:hypothetical protein
LSRGARVALEPVTMAATFCSSTTFQLMYCFDVRMVEVEA